MTPIVERLREAFVADLEVRVGRLEAIYGRLEGGAEDGTLLPRLRAELHDLKGTGTSFGFPEVTAIASHAETFAAGAGQGMAELAQCLAELRRIVDKNRGGGVAAKVGARST